MKKKQFFKQAAVISLSAGLILSSTNFMHSPRATATSMKAENILASLTPAQRQALNQLELKEQNGLQGFTKEELNSDQEIDIIVQFRSKPSKIAVMDAEFKGKKLSQSEADELVTSEHNQFAKDIQSILPSSNLRSGEANHEITTTYQTVYNGVAMTLPANQVESLLKSDVVKAVYKNATFKVDPIPFGTENGSNSPGTSVESLPYLKVDKLRQEGLTGTGIKVGVLDTGIDYNHPDLKNVYKGGYDFIDDDNDPMETTYNDWKESNYPEFNRGSSFYTSHGTHVSGTIAGQATNKDISVEGVAPGVDLYAYRVLGPYGSGSLDGVIAGIEKAVEDGMDVINLSLGDSTNNPYTPTSTAINNAVLSGVTAVVAAGNAGPAEYTVGSPGTAALALTVGASDVPMMVSTFNGEIGNEKTIELVSMARNYTDLLKDLVGKSYEVVDVGLGNNSDYLNKDVQGKITLIARGELSLTDKITNAKKKGAAAVLLYNNVDGQIDSNQGESTAFIPTFSVTKLDGEKIKAQLTAGQITFTFSGYGESQTKGDRLADFSSRGPVRQTYGMKPEVTAPGVSVLSTVPSYMADPNEQENYQFAYSRYSGTSMATPFTAGVAALMLQANPKLKPEDIKTILMNTAEPLNGDYSVFEVGAGRINPYEAVHNGASFQILDKTFIPGAEDLAQIKNLTGGLSFDHELIDKNLLITKSIKVKNNDKKKKTFSVTVTEGKDSNSLKKNGMALLISNKIDLKGNEEKKVSASLLAHKKAKKGYYSGYITLTNTTNAVEQYRIPFSFRLLEEGFNQFSLENPTLSPNHLNELDWDPSRSRAIHTNLNFSAPMDKMDVILQDENGNDLGFAGTIDLKGAVEDYDYTAAMFFGYYYKFTGDAKKPIATEASYAMEGHYKLKFITTGLSGKTFTDTQHIWIYLNQPTFTSSLDGVSPFIEYQPGQKTYPFEIQVTDPLVDEMKKYGVNYDQTSNFMIYYWGYVGMPSSPIHMDQDGRFVEEILMDESNASFPFGMDGYNIAGNKVIKNYYFVKEGTAVSYPTSETTEANTGDHINVNLVLDNLKDITKAEWTFTDFLGLPTTQFVDVKLNDAYKDKATLTVRGSKVTVDFKEPSGELNQAKVVDITFKVLGEEFFTLGYTDPMIAVTDANNNKVKVVTAPFRFKINPQFSRLEGYVLPEGFLVTDKNGQEYLGSKDWAKFGGTVNLIHPDGTVLDATSSIEFGQYMMDYLPLSKDPYLIEMTVPGHFFLRTNVQLGYERNGVVYGNHVFTDSEILVAGDVNQDAAIDVLDALAIQNAWNTNDRAADINFDGVVDAKDMIYVQTNYLLQNEDVENAPEPKTSYNGKTLQMILAELRIAP
jgi:subtilisin family serine protease